MLLITLVLSYFYVLSTHTVRAQTTNTVCTSNSSTSFLYNKAGESPCLLWSKLQSLCIPDSAFVNVPPLVDHTYGYNSPGNGGSACQCNVAAYNLMAACSWCQVGGDSTWASQWAYSAGCTTFQEDGLGFAQEVIDLPPFVWRKWGTARFDPALAAAAAPSIATTSLPPASATLSRSFPPTPTFASRTSSGLSESTGPSTLVTANTTLPTNTTAAVPSASDTDTSNPSHDSNDRDKSGDAGTPWAIILGSIGGSIAGIIIIAMLVFFCFLRRKRRNSPPPPASEEGMEPGVIAKHVSESPDKPAGRRFDPSYHTSKDWKHKHRSFLDILAGPTGAGGPSGAGSGDTTAKTKRQSKRMTELFNDPKSFFSPRTAPRPFAAALKYNNSSDSVETLRYTTTSERLQSRARAESFSSGSEVSFGVGPPKVIPMGYTKAKDSQPPISAMTNSTFAGVTMQGPSGPGLLQAVNVMKKEDEDAGGDKDDPLDTPTPPSRAFGDSPGYPFPRVTTPPAMMVMSRDKNLPKPPPLKSRLSTKIPDSRFSSSAMSMATPAMDFTLPPEEYRRKQSRYYSGPKNMTVYTDTSRASATATLPSLYEPMPGATRFSLSHKTDAGAGKSGGRDGNESDGESLIFSATPSSESRYPSFIPDAQTVQRVKGMFGITNVQFPLPPTTSPRKRASASSSVAERERDKGLSPQEWNKAKGKAKLTQEVMKIGKKDPVQERGNENGTRRGGW